MLPPLPRVLMDLSYVPIVVGQINLAQILLAAIDANTLVIASSDFAHFGPNYDYVPFRSNFADNLKKLDMGAYDFIKAKDLPGFEGYIRKTGATIYGQASISVLLAMLPPNAQGRLLHYDTSGAQMSDYSNSVSY
jgi:MEMO1 family protein